METEKYKRALEDIRQIMQRSSRFISLSGRSGVAAGIGRDHFGPGLPFIHQVWLIVLDRWIWCFTHRVWHLNFKE